MVRGGICNHSTEEITGTKPCFVPGFFIFPLINFFKTEEWSYDNIHKFSVLLVPYDGQLISKLKQMIMGPQKPG